MADNATPTTKERFDVLFGSYARIHERFVETAYKVTGMLLVVLGWLLSSQTARTLLHEDVAIRVICVAVILIAALSILAAFYRLNVLSRSIRKGLDDLSYHDQRYYDHHRIPGSLRAAVVGVNMLLCGLLTFLLIYV
jgi:hypothetical protein